MPIDKEELDLLNDLLDKMDDLDEVSKTTIINNYIVADTANRTVALMMIKDRTMELNKGKKIK